MEKLLNKKLFVRWLSIFLAVVLTITLAPAMPFAYGDNDNNAIDNALVATEENEELAEEGADLELGTEEGSQDEEGLDADDFAAGIAVASVGAPAVSYDNDSNALTAALAKGNVGASGDKLTIKFNDKKTHTVTVPENKTLTANIVVTNGTTLKLEGKGTIQGDNNGSVVMVEASTLELNENLSLAGTTGLTITNGTGSYLNNNGQLYNDTPTAGGGILIQRSSAGTKSSFTMHNGNITSNTAGAGGGVFVDRTCDFTMNNGKITNNIATTHEGGGLYVAGPGTIHKGVVTGNTTKTTGDWGGGGIFVEVKGVLQIDTVKITDNTAGGLGGGISGCPHARIGLGTDDDGMGTITEGAAIFGNHAHKTGGGFEGSSGNPDNEALWALKSDNLPYKGTFAGIQQLGSVTVSGDIYAYDNAADSANFTKEKAQDFYCTRSSVVFGQSLGKVDTSKPAWTGRYAGPTKAGNLTINEGEWFGEADYSLGLTAVAQSYNGSRDLLVSGNTSYTHGGGIGCNGVLIIGSLTKETQTSHSWSVDLKKELLKDGKDLISQYPGTFTFNLYDKDPSDPNNSGVQPVATAQSDANGKITFTVDDAKYAGSATGTRYPFFAQEVKGSDDFVKYDTKVHPLFVTVVHTTETTNINNSSVTTTTSMVTKVEYAENDDTFTNKVQPKYQNTLNGSGSIALNKEYLSGEDTTNIITDKSITDVNKTFTFELFRSTTNEDNEIVADEAHGPVAVATNNATTGNITFTFEQSKTDLPKNTANEKVQINLYQDESNLMQGREETFFVREAVTDKDRTDNPQTDFDTTWHQVKVTFGVASPGKETNVGTELQPVFNTTYNATLSSAEFTKFDEAGNATTIDAYKFINKFNPKAELELTIKKLLYGQADIANSKFDFYMTGVAAPDNNGRINLKDSAADLEVHATQNHNFNKSDGSENTYEANVRFNDIVFTQTGEYWYMITEGDSETTNTDARVYVVKIKVEMGEKGMTLTPSVEELYYAEGIGKDYFGNPAYLDLNALEFVENTKTETAGDKTGIVLGDAVFANFSTNMQTMSLYGYAVNAASNMPIEQECFVDPKIIKNLDGRALKEGEFNFKLIKLAPSKDANGNDVVDWSKTQGDLISETTNDRYGMVDFDAANNVSNDWENPSCLSYTTPGTYYYRVVEANATTDASVLYSQQIITFTTVIELNDQGQLECTDMYYGHVVDGVYEDYKEESKDPTWHPTMTNHVRGMDLQVRKTSVLDREQGLEGATYGLYAANNAEQADIFLGKATSDADGWITFKDVSLTEGTHYYFKEMEAPAGHTVSEFRSSYFYLVADATAPNGYAMMYTDSKSEKATKASDTDMALVAASITTADEDGAAQAGAASGPRSDDGNMLFTFALDGGVYDEETLVEFAKLDTRTHEWVEGASLSIIEKSSGKVVNSWTSGKATERLEGKLNVDTTYILRENNAPEGYAKANDVEFTIDSYGNVSILSGTSNGNAEIQDSTITLYDTMLDGEEVLTEYRENLREVPGDDGDTIVKTSDLFKFGGIALLLAGAIALVLFAKRRANKATAQEGSVAANPTKRLK